MAALAARPFSLAMFLILSIQPGFACEWRIVQNDAGLFFLEQTSTQVNTTHYFYAAVIPFDQPISTLDDVRTQGTPLGRSAEQSSVARRIYTMPSTLRHGIVYLMSSPAKLNLDDKFRIVPVFAQQEKALGSPSAVPSPFKGMTNYGGPLPSPRFTKPEGDWPTNASVCITRW